MSRHSRTRARLDPYHLRVQSTLTLAPYLQARVDGTGNNRTNSVIIVAFINALFMDVVMIAT